jgi:hypothetical protein
LSYDPCSLVASMEISRPSLMPAQPFADPLPRACARLGHGHPAFHRCLGSRMPAVRALAVLGAAAMGTSVVAAREPVVWWIVGYPFPEGPLVVCILAVIITRLVIGLQAQTKGQWALDLAITALCLRVAVLWVQAHQLDLLAAGITRMGIGAAGARLSASP